MIELPFPETRVLGALIEKELTTPDYYPLTLNSLITACNQTTNRDPVVAFDEATVQEATDTLRQKQLATAIFGSGSRTKKFRHDLLDHYALERRELALLATLLLRGAQTPGELRARSERMAGGLLALSEVETALEAMAAGNAPLVRALAPAPGRKERRYVHLLSGEPDEAALAAGSPGAAVVVPVDPMAGRVTRDELEAVREEVRGLREELARVSDAFAEFRRQFE